MTTGNLISPNIVDGVAITGKTIGSQHVAIADNLSDDSAPIETSSWLFRTTAGSASISTGNANVLTIKGNSKLSGNALTILNARSISATTSMNQWTGTYMTGTITSSGVVQTSAGVLAYCYAVGGLDRGYVAYLKNSANIQMIGWSKTIPTDGQQLTYYAEVNNSFGAITFPEDGYVLVSLAATQDDNLTIHPRWSSGQGQDTTWDAYQMNTIKLPTYGTAGSGAVPLPTLLGQFPAVNSSIADEINFSSKTYTKRCGILENTAANMAYVQGLGTSYIYDNDTIIYELVDEIVYTFEDPSSNAFIVNDYGTEWLSSTETGEIVNLANLESSETSVSYGSNLKDTLRVDTWRLSGDNTATGDNIITGSLKVPTVSDTEGENAVNVDYVNDETIANNLVHKSGAEVITGKKTFTGDMVAENGHVGIADQLYDASAPINSASWTFRTTAGDTSISSGTAILNKMQGSSKVIGAAKQTLNITTTPSTACTSSISTWETKVGTSTVTKTFTFDKTNWKLDGSTVDINEYGLYPTTTSYSFTAEASSTLGMTIVESTFHTKTSDAEGYFSFFYYTSYTKEGTVYSNVWVLNNEIVTLSEYGISITGTPVDSDYITVNYVRGIEVTLVAVYTARQLGTLYICNAKSIGATKSMNQWSGTYINGQVDSNGTIGSGTRILAYCRAVGGLATGYVAYSNAGNYITAIGWCEDVPVVGTTLTSFSQVTATNFTNIIFPKTGYVVVEVTDSTSLTIHPRWSSGQGQDTTYDAYDISSNIINLPTAATDSTVLPPANGKFPGVGTACDEIDFSAKIYTKRCEVISNYTAEQLAYVEGLGTQYIYDATTIVYELPTAVQYSFTTPSTTSYYANDYGTEWFSSVQNGTALDLANIDLTSTSISYGSNLKDKLRTDVVTLSEVQTIPSNKTFTGTVTVNTLTTPNNGASGSITTYNLTANGTVIVPTSTSTSATSLEAVNVKYLHDNGYSSGRLAMPCAKTATITLPDGTSSQTYSEYTAPKTGWFLMSESAVSGGGFVYLDNRTSGTTGLGFNGWASSCRILIPVRKGDLCNLGHYHTTGRTAWFYTTDGSASFSE